MNEIKRIEPRSIELGAPVRVKYCGNITEIMHQTREGNTTCGIVKLDKHRYYVKSDPKKTIKYFNHSKDRSENIRGVALAVAKGRDLINTNVINPKFCKFLTLTYKENMTDPKKLYTDFDNFNRYLRKLIGHYEYITAAEPQARGAWHLHVILIFDREVEFIHWSNFAKAWRNKGTVDIRALGDVDNVGLYLSAYLTDIFEEEAEIKDLIATNGRPTLSKEIKGKSKRVIKGGRLHRYPPGMRIFRYSKGIKKPILEKSSYAKAKEKTGADTPAHVKSLYIASGEYNTILTYEYYNRLKPNGQDSKPKKRSKSRK